MNKQRTRFYSIIQFICVICIMSLCLTMLVLMHTVRELQHVNDSLQQTLEHHEDNMLEYVEIVDNQIKMSSELSLMNTSTIVVIDRKGNFKKYAESDSISLGVTAINYVLQQDSLW